MKVTVPVTIAVPGGAILTVATKVTGWPYVEELSSDTKLKPVFALLITCGTRFDVLPLKLHPVVAGV